MRDLKTAHIENTIAPTLQAALDDWRFIAPQLAMLYADLNSGRACRPFDFDHGRCMRRCRAPLNWPLVPLAGMLSGGRTGPKCAKPPATNCPALRATLC